MTDELFQLTESLPEILAQVWRRLERAATLIDDPWHFPALATAGVDGPRVRTLVLREVAADQRMLGFHTDARSPKVELLKVDPRVCLLVYDPVEKIQVQLSGAMELHTEDELARRQWEQTDLSSRRAYLAPLPPGEPLVDAGVNLPQELRDRLPTEQELAAGWPNFCVLLCRVQRIEWLKLHRQGNWRAAFQWEDSGWAAGWHAP